MPNGLHHRLRCLRMALFPQAAQPAHQTTRQGLFSREHHSGGRFAGRASFPLHEEISDHLAPSLDGWDEVDEEGHLEASVRLRVAGKGGVRGEEGPVWCDGVMGERDGVWEEKREAWSVWWRSRKEE